MRGVKTAGKKKDELSEVFDNLRRGINNVPALLQPDPETDLQNMHLHRYEICPSEPLHDIKGHLSNVFEETSKLLSGEALTKFTNICSTVLGKDTLRCSDYRKATILISLALKESNADKTIVEVFRTAAEINELLYANVTKRSPESILRLHNVTYIHATLCIQIFSSPKTITRAKMFGRYFHALVCHAPIVNRIIPLRSINTEVQERMFSQCKQITKSTSNLNPNHVITNIIPRIQEEEKPYSNTLNKFRAEESCTKAC